MQWIPFAMVRITAVFSLGVILCISRPTLVSVEAISVLLLVFLIIYAIAWIAFRKTSSIKIASGIAGLITVFVSGYLVVLLRDEAHSEDHILHLKDAIIAYQAKIVSPAEEKKKSFKRSAIITKVRIASGWIQSSGKINLYWPKTEQVADLDYGDLLVIKGSPREIEPAYNPYEFDFREYLKYKNIFHQHYVRAGEWQLAEHSDEKGFLFYAHRARNWSVSAIKRFISSPREQGLVTALVLGVVDGLDSDLLSAYAASGAMHVLAVSGLHVSIIYGILLLILKPLGKSHSAQWTIAIVSLLLLWGYAFITGLSASVLRAVTMFSFVAVAKPIGRTTNFYNTLAASAFCLLLYDPYLIMSVGFQLSYLAVLGIVYLQRPIYHLWEVKSWFANWAWELSAVSIAAQIATFALGFLYFHQFPVYFLVANLFIIPGSFVVLVGGILLLIVSPFTTIATWLGIGLEWFVYVLNGGIFLVEELPYCLISDVFITPMQCLLLFGCIITIILLIIHRKFRFAVLTTILIVWFSSLSWIHVTEEIDKSRFTVYHIKGHSAMEWSNNGFDHFVADSSFMKDDANIKFHLSANRLHNGIRTINSFTGFSSNVNGLQFFERNNVRYLWISGDYKIPDYLKVDFLIVSNNAVRSLRSLDGHIVFRTLVIDASNSRSMNDRLESEAAKLRIDSYSVLKRGAFVQEL